MSTRLYRFTCKSNKDYSAIVAADSWDEAKRLVENTIDDGIGNVTIIADPVPAECFDFIAVSQSRWGQSVERGNFHVSH
jgi:hypothetical protein